MKTSKEIQSQLRIFDNGGATFDRYTAVFLPSRMGSTYCYIGMSENPTHPQGFGQHGELSHSYLIDNDDTEITVDDLPERAKALVLSNFKDYQ